MAKSYSSIKAGWVNEKKPNTQETKNKKEYKDIKSSDYDFGVDESYIRKFQSSANEYMKNAQNESKDISYQNSSDRYKKYQQNYRELKDMSNTIRGHFNSKKGLIDEKTYNDMISYLDAFDKTSDNAINFYRRNNDFYSNFNDENEYNDWKSYQDMLKYDTESGKKELDELKKLKDSANTASKTKSTATYDDYYKGYIRAGYGKEKAKELAQKAVETNKQKNANADNQISDSLIGSGYNSLDELNNAYEEKNSFYNRAMRLQKSKKMEDDAMKESDFRDVSKSGKEYAEGTSGLFGWSVNDKVGELRKDPSEIENYENMGSGNIFMFTGTRDDKNYKAAKYMTENEYNVYCYYLGKGDSDKAEEYLDSIEETLNARQANENFAKLEGDALSEILFGVYAGTDQFLGGMSNLFSNADYIPASGFQMTSGMVREDLSDVGFDVLGSSLGQIGYDLTTTTSNMIPSILASTIVGSVASPVAGEIVGTSLMGASAAGNAYQEALSLGYDKDQARVYSALTGASEAGLQYLLGGIGKLGGKLSNKAINSFANGLNKAASKFSLRYGGEFAKFIGEMGSEGMEEFLQDILDPYFKAIATGKNVEFGEDYFENAIYSGLLGALSAGVMNSPGAVSSTLANVSEAENIKKSGNVESLKEFAKNTFDASTVAYKLADKVTDKTSAWKLSKLLREVNATIGEQTRTDLQNALVDKGMRESDARSISEWLAKAVNGEEFTNKQIRVLDNNDVVSQVFRDVIMNRNSKLNQRLNGYLQAIGETEVVGVDYDALNLDNVKEDIGNNITNKYANEKAFDDYVNNKLGIGKDVIQSQTSKMDKIVTEKATEILNKKYGSKVSDNGNTVIESTGENVKVKDIASIENGKMMLNTEDGRVVNSNDVEYASIPEAMAFESIKEMGVSAVTGNKILDALKNTNLPETAFLNNVSLAINYGMSGQTERVADLLIDNELGKALYKEGKDIAKKTASEMTDKAKARRNNTKKNSGGITLLNGINEKALRNNKENKKVATIEAAKFLAKTSPLDIYVFESYKKNGENYIKIDGVERKSTANGWFVTGTNKIYIDLNAGNDYSGLGLFTLSHELGHYIRENNASDWLELANAIVAEIDSQAKADSDKQTFEEMANAKYNQYKYIREKEENLIKSGAIESGDYAFRSNEELNNMAYEDVICDSLATFMTEKETFLKLADNIEKTNKGLWNKIKNFIKEFLAKIENVLGVYNDIDAETTAGVAIQKSAMEIHDSIRDLFVSAFEGANANFEMNSSAEEVGIVMDSESESVAPSALNSLRTWNESDYVQSRDQAAEDMHNALGISVQKAKAYIDTVNSIAKMIADDKTRLDYEASPGVSSFVGNTEYGGSIDFSTICKKRRLLTGTFSAIQKALPDTALTAEEVLKIRKMMDDKGYEVSCGLCYVEGSRAKMGEYAKEFLDEYSKKNPEYLPNMAEINTPEGIEKIRIEHPDVYEEYKNFMNALAQRKPKLYQMSTEYKGEILNKFKKSDSVEDKNRNGGLRLQSFSDFEIIHLIDCMQVIMDMSRVGLAGQAYTKVADFAYALGGTGLKINLSLIAKGVDENGHLILDEKEGMKKSDAKKLRDMYSDNVGTIIVVFNDEQLRAALKDDFIDYIIPFHRSQWNSKQYELMGLPKNAKDYTKWQNESYIEPVLNKNGKKLRPDNYMPNTYWDFSKSGKENAEAYLNMCAMNNRLPKFSHLLVNNGNGSYSLQPDGSTDGYWKLLIDFKMYNNDGVGVPQKAVIPNFNMEEAERMLNEYKGGHETFPVAEDVVKEFVDEYKAKNIGSMYSLRSVKPIKPTSNAWKPGVTTEEAMNIYPNLWNVSAEESETRNPTQIVSTVNTYRKIYNILKSEGFDGNILDASSGLGYGTKAGIEEFGFDVDDIEPYPSNDYKPNYTDYSSLNNKYDVIISNAVLNVLPQDQRDALVVKMGELLNDGGRMFVNVRSLSEIKALQEKLNSNGTKKNITISESEVAETSKGSYQKGFTKDELKAYLEDALGDGYTVEKTTKFGGTSVIVTKDANHSLHYISSKDIKNNVGLNKWNDNVYVERRMYDYFSEKNLYGKYTIESDGSEVVISNKTVHENFGKKDLFSRMSSEQKALKLAVTSSLPTIIKNSVFDNYETNRYGKENGFRFYNCDVIIDGKPHIVNIALKGNGESAILYYHLVDMNKKSTNYSTSNTISNIGNPEIDASNVESVPSTAPSVKSKNSERNLTIYVPDGHMKSGKTVNFIDLMLDGKKKGETRTHKSITRKQWVGLGKDGYVYGRVLFGEPIEITKSSPEYKDAYIAGTDYDIKPGETKYYYPILDKEDFRDNPRPIEKNGNYGQYKYSERVLMGSVFSGGGTLESGLVYQMLDKEFAVEYNKKIASVYEDNHGKDHMFVGDIRDFDSKNKDNVFYLHASPVCKSYSNANHSGGEKTLDITTAEATARVLEEQMPQVFTVENVKRYIGSDAYNIITSKLDELGYNWDVDVYNASDYGNPTKRERMVIRAVKSGELPSKPQKVTKKTSWYEATKDLFETDLIPSNLVKSKIDAIRNTPGLKNLSLTKLDKPLMIYDTTKSKQVTYAWGDELAPTLTTKCGDARIIWDGKVYEPTPKFMGRLQGIPDNFKYPKAKTNAFKIIGNGIPTQLTKAVMGGVLDSAYEQTHNGEKLYSERNTVPTFYSHMSNVIDGIKTEKVGASGVIPYLKGKGVKDEEIKWSGIEEFLDGKKSVTKSDLQEFAKNSMLQIEESSYSLSNYDELYDLFNRVANINIIEYEDFDGKLDTEKLKNTVNDYYEDGDITKKEKTELINAINNNKTPRWYEYALPGATNYREILFKVPGSDYSNNAMLNHWGEKGVLAHARVDDQTILGGERVLFVEEVQSDWHNDGNKKGYGTKEDIIVGKTFTKLRESVGEKMSVNPQGFRSYAKWFNETAKRADIELSIESSNGRYYLTNMGFIELNVDDYSEFRNQLFDFLADADYEYNTMNSNVPDAPFRNGKYIEFVMKRLIRMAAEEGYDYIGWTTADMQEERWSSDYAEGYRIEYDQDIPKFMNKYGKKWGGTVSKEVLDETGDTIWAFEIPESMKESALYEGQALYSERNTSLDSRTLLSNALAETAMNDVEKKYISDYQENIGKINELQNHLAEVRSEIKELSFAKGKRDNEAIRKLTEDANKTANRINIYDKKLLKLEATKPLRDVLEREKAKAIKMQKAKSKEELAKYRERYAESVQKVVDSYKDRTNSRKATELRNKVKKYIEEFRQRLLNPTERRYIPAKLVGGIIDVYDAIDPTGVNQETKSAEKYRNAKEALANLKIQYDSLKTMDYEFSSEFNEEFSQKIADLSETVGDKALRDMGRDQLEDVYTIIHDISAMIKDATKQIGKADAITNYEAGTDIISEMRAIRAKGLTTNAISDLFRYWTENSMRAVKEMTVFNRSSRLMELFNDLNSGRRKADKFKMDSNKKFEVLRSTKEGMEAFNDAVEKPFDFGIYDMDGNKVMLSKMQAMEALLLYKREESNANRNHLSTPVRFTDVALDVKGKYNDAFDKGHDVMVDQDFVAKVMDKLSDWDMKYLELASEFFNKDSKDAINEVSMVTKHRPIATEENYIPYHVNQDYIAKENDNLKFDATIEGMGMLKSVKNNAPQQLVVRGLNSVIDEQINNVAKVYGLAIPVRNFNKAWNIKETKDDGGKSVISEVRTTWGDRGVNLISQSVADLQSPRRSDSSNLFAKARGAFVVSTLGGNVSVLIKQAASYPTAGSILSAKSLAKALPYFGRNLSNVYEEIDKYTPQHWTRRQGMSTQELGDANQTHGWQNKLNNKLGALSPMNWIQAMDVKTTAVLWKACEYEVESNGTSRNSETFGTKVADLYNKVIEDTQPMYDPLHRAEITKKRSEFLQSVVMFQTQPLQNSGILREGAMEYKMYKKKYGNDSAEAKMAFKKYKKAIVSQAASHLTFTAMTLLAAAFLHKMNPWRDDEDKEVTLESIEKEFGKEFLENYIGAVLPIVGSYAISGAEKIFEGSKYDVVSDPTVDKINSSIDAFNKMTSEPSWDAFVNMSTDVASYLGIPAKNVLNIINGIKLHIEDAVNDEFLSFEAGVDRTNSQNVLRMFEEYMDGNTDKMNSILSNMITEKVESGKEEKDVKSSIKSSVTKELKPIFLEAYANKENDTMANIRKFMSETKLYDDVIKTTQTWIKESKK